ncbi:MAG: hypothetical protein AB1552_05780 [Nitrospirota bacterium]
MKRSFAILVISIASLCMLACDQKPKNPVSEYGDSLVSSYRKGQQAGEMANLDAVRKAVAAYRASHDKYPENLDAVKELLRGDVDLSRYDYNPSDGTVSLKQ